MYFLPLVTKIALRLYHSLSETNLRPPDTDPDPGTVSWSACRCGLTCQCENNLNCKKDQLQCAVFSSDTDKRKLCTL